MKNNKIAFLAPILVVVCAVGILLIRTSYSVVDTPMPIAAAKTGTNKYYYIRRNMLSHHFISNNSDPSGTILIKSGSVTSVDGDREIVYCAHKGKNISKSRDGHYYKKVEISKTSVSALKKAKDNLIGVMTNSYPYISLAELKSRIKAGIGEAKYNELLFDTLDAQEAMTATQAAIWNAIDGKENNKYASTKKIGSIKYANFHKTKSNSVWPINWDSQGAYNIHSNCYKGTGSNLDCGSKSTFLADGDTAANTSAYKQNNSKTLVKNRINKLIDWYFTLKGNSNNTGAGQLPTFTAQQDSISWSNQGKTLTVAIISNNNKFTYSPENEYNIEFKDINGKVLTPTSATPLKIGDLTIGYKYVIDNIEANGVIAYASAFVNSTASNVYIYESDVAYKNTQYLIGVDPGFLPAENEIRIFNSDQGKVYLYKTNDVNASDKPVTYSTRKDDICGSAEKPCQAGAQFIIYGADGTTVMKSDIETDTTPTEIDLPLGTYYIEELSAPAGYVTNKNKISFTLESKDSVVGIHYNNVPTRLCVQKVSSEDTHPLVDGATLQIQSMLGGIYEDFTTFSEENNGIHCTDYSQLPEGIYYIRELAAPANFIKTNKIYRVRVGSFEFDDIVEEVVFADNIEVVDLDLKTVNDVPNVAVIENKPGTVITKSDLATGECVEGAHLVVKDESGRQVDEWTSTCEEGNDSHTLQLSEGKYTLTEQLTPSGYATAESIEFQVSSDGKVNTSLDMKDAPINACFMKVSGSQEGIEGAEFTIYDSNNKEYNKFTSTDGEVCFQYMPVGKYKIRETKAPEGYEKLKEDIEIEIKDTSETQRFKINNETIANKTAQDSSQFVIIIASIFMLVGLGLVGYYGYKKQS